MAAPASPASLDEWLPRLETFSPREIELGLERVSRVLSRLELPRSRRVLTIGGTNGKGSSVAMLESLLRQSGAAVGCYTSPHILDYRERIRVDGQAADAETIVAAFERIEQARDDVPLTYFEFSTLAALCVFAERGVENAVLEVGLGGRLDAVNAVDTDGCLITNVSLDHCDWLGDDIESIAREKAGIMRAGRPAVFGSAELPRAVEHGAASVGADLIVAGRDFTRSGPRDGQWDWSGRGLALQGLSTPALGGEHQLDNASAVLALLEAVGLTSVMERLPVNTALGELDLIGRLQSVDVLDRRWLLDGAHNPAGARALAAALPELSKGGRVIAVIGILDDKDAEGVIRAIATVADHWIACDAASPRAITGAALARRVAAVTGNPCRIAVSVEAALLAAVEASFHDDLILVAGSFYTVGPALRWLGKIDGGRT